MTIEGLGKKFQEARLARKLTLDEAARLTKIRPSRLAEIEADDFSNFPSLAYAKGFLQIYGKFLDVDVSSYMEAFETSEHVTIDGYSYLQEEPAPQPVTRARPRAPTVQRTGPTRPSLVPVIVGIVVLAGAAFLVKLFLDIQRLAPREAAASPTPAATQPATAPASTDASATSASPAPTAAPSGTPAETAVAAATPAPAAETPPPAPAPGASEPQVRRAEAVRPEDLAQAAAAPATTPVATPVPTASPAKTINRVDIRPLRKTYIEVSVDNERAPRGFWISPEQGPVAFTGQRVSIRVLDPSAVQIRKNGKLLQGGSNVTVR